MHSAASVPECGCWFFEREACRLAHLPVAASFAVRPRSPPSRFHDQSPTHRSAGCSTRVPGTQTCDSAPSIKLHHYALDLG